MLRVCFITEDFYPSIIGGQGIYGKNLVEALIKKNVAVTVLAEKREGREKYWRNKKNIQVFLVPFVFGNQLLLALLEYIYFLLRFNKVYFDIVHVNQLSGLFFVLFKPTNVGKVLVSVHNTYADLSEKTSSVSRKTFYQPLMLLEGIVYKRADGLIFNTSSEKILLDKNYHTSSISSRIAPFGAPQIKNLQKEKRDAEKLIRKKLGLTNEKIILYVGRLVKRKRVDVVVRMLKTLERQKGIVGVIIGDGPEREYLESIACKNTFFVGFEKNPQQYFLGADVFVNFSVAEGGVILTALEAASCGLPMLLSHESVEESLLKNGYNGYYSDSQNPHILAKKVYEILKKARQMGENSRKLVRQYTWDNCARQTISFYQSVQKEQYMH